MTKITTFLTNPYLAEDDDITVNIVNETVEEVTECLLQKGYKKDKIYWVKSDSEGIRWVYLNPFSFTVEKLDDVI